ncbi:MAG TPA: LytTR family DNA-binding domain-containing protein [Saprospiraceae bacterium]|nr:LytTR family DNA-binding domain-containing protein [Saprospiraceae bacterium]
MNLIKTVLVDDEPRGLKVLELLTSAYADRLDVVAACTDPQEAIIRINDLTPELLIMDIQMPTMTAFDILASLQIKQLEIIFVTAHNQYALRAFQYSAVDYLLKPIDEDQFHKAITKAIERIGQKNVHQNYEALLYNIQQLKHANDMKICIPDAKGFRVIRVSDIVYCEAESCYTIFHLENKTSLMSSRTLAEYDGLLDPDVFFRIHRSYIVNLQHIKEYHKGEGGQVIMDNQKALEISRRKKEEFFSRMKGMYKY